MAPKRKKAVVKEAPPSEIQDGNQESSSKKSKTASAGLKISIEHCKSWYMSTLFHIFVEIEGSLILIVEECLKLRPQRWKRLSKQPTLMQI